MKITATARLIGIYYLFILAWWISLQILRPQNLDFYPTYNYLYQYAFGLIPLIGGVLGIARAKEWGFLQSKVGAAILFISLGLITWGIGQMFWSIFYNLYLKVDIPYPSLADAGYILSWPLWTIGMIKLSGATGARFSLNSIRGKLLLLIIPLVMIAVSYYLLIIVARGGAISDFTGGSLKIFFDLAYPIGDVFILTITALILGLSFNYLGGRFKLPILILLLGFVVNYIVDFSFSYTTTVGSYYNGHWVDILFPTVMMLIALGINSLDTKST